MACVRLALHGCIQHDARMHHNTRLCYVYNVPAMELDMISANYERVKTDRGGELWKSDPHFAKTQFSRIV